MVEYKDDEYLLAPSPSLRVDELNDLTGALADGTKRKAVATTRGALVKVRRVETEAS